MFSQLEIKCLSFLSKNWFIIHCNLVYVDYIIIIDDNNKLIQHYVDLLDTNFPLKDLYHLSFFLDVEVVRIDEFLNLSQGKYIRDFLHKNDLNDFKSLPTPVTPNKPLSKFDGKLLDGPTLCKSVVGGLQYYIVTWPDIGFITNKLCQFFQAPTEAHWLAAKQVLMYLKGIMGNGLLVHKSTNVTLTTFSNAEWASCNDDWRSIDIYCVFHGNSLISWFSRK